MNRDYADDPAFPFLEHAFPGRRMLAWSVVMLLSAMLADRPELSGPFHVALLVTVVVGLVLYFWGYWRAVVGKGYSRMLFVAAFAPVVGLILIFMLPPLARASENESPAA